MHRLYAMVVLAARTFGGGLLRVCDAAAGSKSVSKGTIGWLVLHDQLPSVVSIGLAFEVKCLDCLDRWTPCE